MRKRRKEQNQKEKATHTCRDLTSKNITKNVAYYVYSEWDLFLPFSSVLDSFVDYVLT